MPDALALFSESIDQLRNEYKKNTGLHSWNARAAIHSMLNNSEIKLKIGFDKLFNAVSDKTAPSILLQNHIVEQALIDYLMMAAIKSSASHDAIFRNEDIDLAKQWLAEDLNVDLPTCRGYSFVSNVWLPESSIDIDEVFRLRRATRFEVRSHLEWARSWDSLDPELRDSTRTYDVYPIYLIERIVRPEELAAPNQMSTKHELEIANQIEKIVRCLRLFGCASIGISRIRIGCWTDTTMQCMHQEPKPEIAPYRQMRRRSLDGRTEDVYETVLEFDNEKVKQFKGFWIAYNDLFSEASKFPPDYDRAIIRYLQALNEYYIEDLAIDLAISLEALFRVESSSIPSLVASLVGTTGNESDISDDIAWLFDLRHRHAHGGVPKEIDMSCLEQARTIVATVLFAPAFLTSNHYVGDDGFGRFIQTLLESPARFNKSRSDIPSWVFALIA